MQLIAELWRHLGKENSPSDADLWSKSWSVPKHPVYA